MKGWTNAQILLVEDEVDSMDVLQETLLCVENGDFRFTFARNGVEALQVIESQPIDVVVADILMPQMSGLHMLRKMREMGYYIPCLFVTSLKSLDIAIEALRGGAFDFIEKPLSLQKIEDPIKKAIVVSRAFKRLEGEFNAKVGDRGAYFDKREIVWEVLRLKATRFQCEEL